jgi:RimJ/RimL family protein N-acetyltransferase
VINLERDATALAAAAAGGQPCTPLAYALRDGTQVLLRPVRTDDTDRIRRGFEELSPRSRYLRFHVTVADELSAEQLADVTRVDHRDHVVWVALEAEAPEGPIVGLASYVRLPAPPATAEAAVAVVDRLQGRGLGSALLCALVQAARVNDIAVLRGYVLAHNAAMLRLVDGVGAVREPMPRGVEVVEVPIAPDPDGREHHTVQDVLRTFAKRPQELLLAGLHPLLWSGRSSESRFDAEPWFAPPTAGRERSSLAAWVDAALAEDAEDAAAPTACEGADDRDPT